MKLTEEELEALIEKENSNNSAAPLHEKDAVGCGETAVADFEKFSSSERLDEKFDVEKELQEEEEEEEAVSNFHEEEVEVEQSKTGEKAFLHPSENAPVEDNTTPTSPQKSRRKRRDPLQWLNGNAIRPLLKREFLFPALWIAFLLFCNIYLGFVKIDKIRKIDELETRLRKIYYKQLFTTGEISNMDRREAVWERLQERGSTLAPPKDAPFVIYYDGKVFEKEKKEREKR